MASKGKIKVLRNIKPIHFKDRIQFELVLGGKYFVSFGNNNASPCKLVAIEGEGPVKRITIEIPETPRSKNGFIDVNGEISHHWVSTHSLFSDEIGRTPEEAVKHEMTW